MKPQTIHTEGRISTDLVKDGISIEEEMRKALKSGEPINATAHIEYSNRADGVLPQFDIRTDRFEYARLATDKVHATSYASRMEADGYVKDENGHWTMTKPEGEFQGEQTKP